VIRSILLPIDGSAAATAIIPQLELFLSRINPEVTVLEVIDTLATDYAEDAADEKRRDIDRAREEADKVVEKLVADGLRAHARVTPGPAAATILEVAEREQVSLIAMATHGRTGLPRWTLGSVTEKVLRASKVPMLIMRSFEGDGDSPTIQEAQQTFGHILVPIDGSEESLDIVPLVSELAKRSEARVTVVHFVSQYINKAAMQTAQGHLVNAYAAFTKEGTTIDTELRHGDPAVGILDYATKADETSDIDLIAMSTHGRSGIARWMLGSVTEKVVRHAKLPMLVMRSQD
jgi:nucleotide-binding universal stress UspA family protein